jgi:membrane protein DedA with SNARE-associated domain
MMMERQRRGLLKSIRTQLLLLGFWAALVLASQLGYIPSSTDLLELLRSLFLKYGFVVLALCSLLENVVGFNVYFPGSVVILTGMALTAGQPLRAAEAWLVILVFAALSHNLNFFAGRKLGNRSGLVPESVSHRLGNEAKLTTLFLGTFWHPHFAAVTSLACGARGVPYRTFLFNLVIGMGLWYAFWGLVMYSLGRALPERLNLLPVFLGYILCWIAWDVIRFYRSRPMTD